MKISPKVCLTKRQDVISLCCEKTGITSAIILPALPAVNGKEQVFEYIHPLSYWSNAQGMIKAGRGYLEKLEPPILAGLILTAYEHFNLLDRYTLSAQEANAVLCTASDSTLIDLVSLAAYFTEKNTIGSPSLVLEWNDIRYMVTIDRSLAAYVKTLKQEFITPTGNEEQDRQKRITVLNSRVREGKAFKNGVVLLSAKQSMADFEKDFEVTFKSNKKELKNLLTELRPGLEPKLAKFLDTVLASRNLVSMNKETREKLCNKLGNLTSSKTTRMAELIRECDNPYDIFAKADDLLERATDEFRKEVKPRSLAEILAAKRNKNLGLNLASEAKHVLASDTDNLANPNTSSSSEATNNKTNEEVEDLLDTVLIEDDGTQPYQFENEEEQDEQEEEEVEDMVDRLNKSLYSSQDF